MSGLTLTLREAPRQRVDMSPLTPTALKEVDVAALARIELESGNRRIPVDELFALTPGDPTELRIVNSCGKLDRIGQGMGEGTITVEGDAGAYLGLAQCGGCIVVHGGVGLGAAMEMRAGTIHIHGRAGDLVGGALPGDMRGMSGGLVVVHGDAGDRVGDRMRRGTIIVEGNAGGYAASRMIAGTVIILGTVGPYPGYGMKRGSLMLRARAERELPSFSDCGRHELGFVRLLFRTLRGCSSRLDELASGAPVVRRLAGDHAVDGKGEILILED